MPIGIDDDHVELADAFGKWAGSLGRHRGGPGGGGRPGGGVRRAVRGGGRDGAGRDRRARGDRRRRRHPARPRGRARGGCRCAGAGPAARHGGGIRGARRAGRSRCVGGDAGGAGAGCRRPGPRRARCHPRSASFAATRCCWSRSTKADLAPGSSPDLTRRTSIGDLSELEATVVPGLDPGAAAVARGHPGRRRGLRGRPLVPRHGRRVRRAARAVRPEDRRASRRSSTSARRCSRPASPSPPRPGTPPGRPATTTPSSTSSRRWSPGPSASTVPSRSRRTCIQVLGGIGFTFEHDAHLYLRRAMALRSLLGPHRLGTPQRAGRPRRDATPDAWSAWTSPTPRRASATEVRERVRADRRPARGGPPRSPGGERLPDAALAGAARPGCRPGAAAGHRRGARSRRGRRAPTSRSAPGPRRRSSTTAPTSSASGSSARRCAARSSGASCSASPARARTSRR